MPDRLLPCEWPPEKPDLFGRDHWHRLTLVALRQSPASPHSPAAGLVCTTIGANEQYIIYKPIQLDMTFTRLHSALHLRANPQSRQWSDNQWQCLTCLTWGALEIPEPSVTRGHTLTSKRRSKRGNSRSSPSSRQKSVRLREWRICRQSSCRRCRGPTQNWW